MNGQCNKFCKFFAWMSLLLPAVGLAENRETELQLQLAREIRSVTPVWSRRDYSESIGRIRRLFEEARQQGFKLDRIRNAGILSQIAMFGNRETRHSLIQDLADLGLNVNYTSKDWIREHETYGKMNAAEKQVNGLVGVGYAYDSSLLHRLVENAALVDPARQRARYPNETVVPSEEKEARRAYKEIVDTIKFLRRKGADIDVVDKYRGFFNSDSTPLMVAVKIGSVDLVRELLAMGADPLKSVEVNGRAMRPEDLVDIILRRDRDPNFNPLLPGLRPRGLSAEERRLYEQIRTLLREARLRDARSNSDVSQPPVARKRSSEIHNGNRL